MLGSPSMSSPGRLRREQDERERLEKMLVAATMARAKEEENLQAIASLEERHEKQLRLQARQRHDMEKRRMLNQDEDDKFIRLLDHGYNKQATADERLRTIAKEREAAIDAKRDKFTAKRQAILAAKKAEQEDLNKQATKVISLGSGVGGGKGKIDPSRTAAALKVKARTPRGSSRSPRRGGSPARGATMDSTGSIGGGRHESLKERRLEAEKATLLARIQKEQDRLADIQRQKEEHREQIMRRRTMRQQAESAATGAVEVVVDDDEPPGTADAGHPPAGHPGASGGGSGKKSGGAGVGGVRRMASPRRPAKPAPKFDEFTKKEKERLGIIKKQRCAVCTRVYELENLPGVVSYRAVEKLREKWGKEFGSAQAKDPRYSCPTKLYDQVRVCVFCFQFFDPDEDEGGGRH